MEKNEFSKVDFAKTLAELKQNNADSAVLAEVYHKYGDVCKEESDYNQAIENHTQAINHYPNDAAAYCGRGDAYRKKAKSDFLMAEKLGCKKTANKIPRTEKSFRQIKLAFFGATHNLCLLENSLVKIRNIPVYQYSNYLSQLALCIELGLKSIIVNADDFEPTHDIEKLFLASPGSFQQKLKSSCIDGEFFNSNMKNLKKTFEDFRYMNTDSTLNEYLVESALNCDKTIDMENTTELSNYQFARMLLEKIIEYENCIREKSLKQMPVIDCSSPDFVIERYMELAKVTQSNIVLCERIMDAKKESKNA